MQKPIKPVPPKPRPAVVAYRTYAQKASMRFDLEGQIETDRQQRAKLSLTEASGDRTVTEHVRSVLQQERAH